MKRFIALILATLLCLSMAACSGDPTPADINYDTLKVAVICASSDEEEYSEAAAYLKQLETAASMVGIKKNQLVLYNEVSITNSALAEEAIEECIQEGCAIIFGTSEGYATAMKNLAKKYPRVSFVGLGEADKALDNYYAFRIKTYEGAYFCGLVAGIRSESGVLGMIAPKGKEDIETCQIANAFLLGARVTNAKATLNLISVDAARSATKEEEAVKALDALKCDMVLITTRGDAARTCAAKEGMIALNMYTDPAQEDANVLYSVMPRFGDVFADAMQAILSDAKPYYTDKYFGYVDGLLTCTAGSIMDKESTYGDIYVLPGEIQSVLFKGEWDVFSGEAFTWKKGKLTAKPAAIKDTEGNEKIAASAGIPSDKTLTAMDWLMEGITVKE